MPRLLQMVFDRRNLTLLFFMVIALSITWSTIGQIERNYNLEQKAKQLQGEIDILAQQKINQDLENQFFLTDYYLDLAARDKLGLVSEGEKVLVLSNKKLEAAALELNLPSGEQAEEPAIRESASNIEQWYRFFSGQEPL